MIAVAWNAKANLFSLASAWRCLQHVAARGQRGNVYGLMDIYVVSGSILVRYELVLYSFAINGKMLLPAKN